MKEIDGEAREKQALARRMSAKPHSAGEDEDETQEERTGEDPEWEVRRAKEHAWPRSDLATSPLVPIPWLFFICSLSLSFASLLFCFRGDERKYERPKKRAAAVASPLYPHPTTLPSDAPDLCRQHRAFRSASLLHFL